MKKSTARADATINEMATLGGKYQTVTGDFNADIDKIAPLKKLIDQGWIDLGAHASIWGKQDKEYTCLSANANQDTRRDYMLASPDLFPFTKNFEVVHNNGVPTLSTLRCTISPPVGQQFRRGIRRPGSITQALKNQFNIFYPELAQHEDDTEQDRDEEGAKNFGKMAKERDEKWE